MQAAGHWSAPGVWSSTPVPMVDSRDRITSDCLVVLPCVAGGVLRQPGFEFFPLLWDEASEVFARFLPGAGPASKASVMVVQALSRPDTYALGAITEMFPTGHL